MTNEQAKADLQREIDKLDQRIMNAWERRGEYMSSAGFDEADDIADDVERMEHERDKLRQQLAELV